MTQKMVISSKIWGVFQKVRFVFYKKYLYIRLEKEQGQNGGKYRVFAQLQTKNKVWSSNKCNREWVGMVDSRDFGVCGG